MVSKSACSLFKRNTQSFQCCNSNFAAPGINHYNCVMQSHRKPQADTTKTGEDLRLTPSFSKISKSFQRSLSCYSQKTEKRVSPTPSTFNFSKTTSSTAQGHIHVRVLLLADTHDKLREESVLNQQTLVKQFSPTPSTLELSTHTGCAAFVLNAQTESPRP